jgi:hypothetical protein
MMAFAFIAKPCFPWEPSPNLQLFGCIRKYNIKLMQANNSNKAAFHGYLSCNCRSIVQPN